MRITGGRARGIPLKAPKGDGTRPATDRMRESVFSSLGPSVEGCRVADLFAGTESGVTEENIQSRARGVILMAISNKFGYMVATTGNKSEMSVGYATLYGDMNGALCPLGDVLNCFDVTKGTSCEPDVYALTLKVKELLQTPLLHGQHAFQVATKHGSAAALKEQDGGGVASTHHDISQATGSDKQTDARSHAAP